MFELSSLLPPALVPWATAAMIFVARLMDVSIGTVRIITLSRGAKLLAPVLGFFEVLVWLVAIRGIFENLTHVGYYFAFAGGFAAGTWAGMVIEDKLALGTLAVRVITRTDAADLVARLNRQDFGVTSVSARGASGRVRMVVTIVKRRDLDRVLEIVERLHPRAFVSITDVRTASEGVFPRRRQPALPPSLLRWLRKTK